MKAAKTTRSRAFVGREISCPFPGNASGIPNKETNSMTHLGAELANAFAHHFDFITLPLVRPGLRRDQSVQLTNGNLAPATFSDKELQPSQWSTSVLGQVQTFPFAPDPTLQQPAEPQRQLRAAEEALADEIAWAVHLGLSAVLIPPPRRMSECSMYARAFNINLQNEVSTMHLWLEVPLCVDEDTFIPSAPSTSSSSKSAPVSSSSSSSSTTSSTLSTTTATSLPTESSWEIWNRMRCYCEFSTRLHVCLTLTSNLPPKEELSRWMGEPVKGCVIPTNVFLTNNKGFPVLSKPHQEFLIALFNYDVQFIIRPSGDNSIDNTALQPYLQYLLHLQTKRPEMTQEEAYTRSYYDYLQAPLQPLMDNLESATYDTFEKDPIKYSQVRLKNQSSKLKKL